jgi:hypothetical protein
MENGIDRITTNWRGDEYLRSLAKVEMCSQGGLHEKGISRNLVMEMMSSNLDKNRETDLLTSTK